MESLEESNRDKINHIIRTKIRKIIFERQVGMMNP